NATVIMTSHAVNLGICGPHDPVVFAAESSDELIGCWLLGKGGPYRRYGSVRRNVEWQWLATFCFQQFPRPCFCGIHKSHSPFTSFIVFINVSCVISLMSSSSASTLTLSYRRLALV